VALSCGKDVAIEMEGKETELDKTIIEAIKTRSRTWCVTQWTMASNFRRSGKDRKG